MIWDFDATSTITNGIQASGSGAYLVDGNMFYSVDQTGFLARADALGDTASTLAGIANSRLGSGAPAAFEQPSGFAYTRDDGSIDTSDARFWADFIASTSQYGETSTTLGYNNHLYGLALGYERDFDAATTFGLMGGYLGGKIKAESRFITSQEIDTQGGFAGVYGSHEFADEITLSGSLIAGRSNNDSKRTFNNNTVVPAFTETASGFYGSTRTLFCRCPIRNLKRNRTFPTVVLFKTFPVKVFLSSSALTGFYLKDILARLGISSNLNSNS